jgi:hypothetical protein
MRKLILILLFIPFQLFAQHWWVDNTGTGDTLATIAEVNALGLGQDDTVSFKNGCTWRGDLTVSGSGTAGHYVVFNSYGTGDRPKILGSEKAITWTAEGHTNIWQSDSSLSDPYNISGYYESEIFYRETGGTINWSDAKKTYTSDFSNLVNEYDWTWNANKVYIYAATDPNSRYTSVEIPQRGATIFIDDYEYITIDGLEISYAVERNINAEYPAAGKSGLIIKNCYIHHTGSRYLETGYNISVIRSNMLIQDNEVFEGGRRNTSFHIYGTTDLTYSDMTVEGNYLHNGYHSTGIGFALDNEDDTHYNNIIIRNNFVYDPPEYDPYTGVGSNNEMCTVRAIASGSDISNVEIYNNIFMYPSGFIVWFQNVNNASVYNNTFYDFNHNIPTAGGNIHQINIDYDCTDIKIKNNVFYGTVSWSYNNSCHNVVVGSSQETTEIDMDYNLFYQTDSQMGMVVVDGDYYRTNTPFSDITTDHGWEVNGDYGNSPQFISSTNLHLQESSPAINAGVAISGYDYDYDGVEVVDPPNIGCYEYVSVGAITLTVQDSTHSHVAENVAIIQAYNLIVQDSVHSHVADNLDLIENKILVIQDAEHSHVVDNVILTQNHILAVADSVHEHVVDNVLLTQDHVLVVADSFHVHSVDSPSLIQNYLLIVQDSDHIHLADSVVLVQDHFLVVQDSIHSHIADNVILVIIEDTELVVQNSFHSHIADNAKVYILFLESTVKLMGVITQMELQGEVQQGKLYGVTDEIFLGGKI